jgi:hypothetical protein
MTWKDSEALVEVFWRELWREPQDPAVIDQLIHRDFTLTAAGGGIEGRPRFKAWMKGLRAGVDDLQLHTLETFANHDDTRVGARWRMTGGAAPNGRPFELAGTALWEVGAHGLVLHNWSIDTPAEPAAVSAPLAQPRNTSAA